MRHATFPEHAQRAAVHCDALLARRIEPAERGDELLLASQQAAFALREALAEAWSDPALDVRPLPLKTLAGGELAGELTPLAVWSLHRIGPGTMLLAVEARPLLEQLDRALGGTGDIGPLPATLPTSADLYAQRLEPRLMAALAKAVPGAVFEPGERGCGPVRKPPFPGHAELVLLAFEVTGGAGRPWRLTCAVESAALPALLPRGAPRAHDAARPAPTLTDPPYADLPLDTRATLVDMDVPLHRLAGLAPGLVLPIIVTRNVPLAVGDTVLATGSVGEVDEQVALMITRTFF